MGHITPTPAGNFRANWREPTGRKKTKTFETRREAKAYLAEVESAKNRGSYVDPHAGRIRFRAIAERWEGSVVTGARDRERIRSTMRTHVIPKWGDWPIGKIDHLAVQEWVKDLSTRLAPPTVAKCYRTLAKVLRLAVRSRLIAADPSEGVEVPAVRFRVGDLDVAAMPTIVERLLPAVPAEHRTIVATAAGAGLRWSECAGLAWGNVDLDRDELQVTQVAEETAGKVVIRPYPKTRAGRRTVPMAPFLVAQLRARLGALPADPDPQELVFATGAGTPLRRSNFRRQVWRAALVRAGLLGRVEQLGEHRFRARGRAVSGLEWTAEFATEREAVAHLATRAAGGLRFHDLRHSYATWLVSRGVPVNDVAAVMGHGSPTTTLRLYTHPAEGRTERIMKAFTDEDGSSAYFPPSSADDLDHSEATEDDDDDV